MDHPNKYSGSQLERGQRKRSFLYRQIADLLRAEIDAGHYRPGDRLPSMDELAERYQVTKVTARRSLQLLQTEGVLDISPARGCFVIERSPAQLAEPLTDAIPVIGVVSCVIVPGETGFYHAAMLDAIRHELQKRVASLMWLPVAHLREAQANLVPLVLRSRLNGVIYIGPFESDVLRRLVLEGPPAVVLDFALRGVPVDCISLDNREGAAAAMAHLIGLGHRRLAIIAGSPCQTATEERLAGAREALAEAGLASDQVPVAYGDFDVESGRRAMTGLLDGPAAPTGVFCMNDEMAAGALFAAANRGIEVPRQLSIVGFDDVPLSRSTHPALTTVAVPVRQMCRLGLAWLTEAMNGSEHVPSRTVLTPTLICRESTAHPC